MINLKHDTTNRMSVSTQDASIKDFTGIELTVWNAAINKTVVPVSNIEYDCTTNTLSFDIDTTGLSGEYQYCVTLNGENVSCGLIEVANINEFTTLSNGVVIGQ